MRSSSYWGWTGGQESVKQVDFKETMGSERLVWESRSDIINGNSRDKYQTEYRKKELLSMYTVQSPCNFFIKTLLQCLEIKLLPPFDPNNTNKIFGF